MFILFVLGRCVGMTEDYLPIQYGTIIHRRSEKLKFRNYREINTHVSLSIKKGFRRNVNGIITLMCSWISLYLIFCEILRQKSVKISLFHLFETIAIWHPVFIIVIKIKREGCRVQYNSENFV